MLTRLTIALAATVALVGIALAQTPTPTPLPGCYHHGVLKSKDDAGQPYYALGPELEFYVHKLPDSSLRGYITYNVVVASTGQPDPALARKCLVELDNAGVLRVLGTGAGAVQSGMVAEIRAAEGL